MNPAIWWVYLNIRPPRAPWGPLDSGQMNEMMMMMRSLLSKFLNRHKKMASFFKRTFGATRCSKVLHPGFYPGL